MFRSAVVSLGLIFVSQGALATVCSAYVQAYSEYTQKVEGKIVKKHSIFEMTDWTRNSRFQGLVLTEKAPANAELVLETRASSKSKTNITIAKETKPFEQDKKYRVVDLNIEQKLGSAPGGSGAFVVTVMADGKELCSEKKLIYNDGD